MAFKGEDHQGDSPTPPQVPAKRRPFTIATYFVVAGVDWRQTLADNQLSELELLDPAVSPLLHTTITDRYPRIDYADAALDQNLTQFCFPIGPAIKTCDNNTSPPKCHFFTMTSETHTRMHGTVLSVMEPMPDNIRQTMPSATFKRILQNEWLLQKFQEFLHTLQDPEPLLQLSIVKEVGQLVHGEERERVAAELLKYLWEKEETDKALEGVISPQQRKLMKSYSSSEDKQSQEATESTEKVESASSHCKTLYTVLCALLEKQVEPFTRHMTKNGPLLAQRCLVLMSPFEYFELFSSILMEILSISKEQRPIPVPLERVIQHVVCEIPEPPPGKLRVCFKLYDSARGFRCSKPPLNCLPLLDIPLRTMFERLSPEKVITLFNAAVLEYRIVLASKDLLVLGQVAKGLCALLFPLVWQSPYIPVMPSTMLNFVHAPCPFIFGIHKTAAAGAQLNSDGFVFVDLDEDLVKIPVGDDVPQPPQECLNKLVKALRKQVYGERLFEKRERLPPASPRPLSPKDADSIKDDEVLSNGSVEVTQQSRWHRNSGISTLGPMRGRSRRVNNSTGTESGTLFHCSMADFNLNVREIFLRFFVSLLQNYRQHMGGMEVEEASLFDKDGFVSGHPESSNASEYLTRLVYTQMMQMFFEDRIFAADRNFEVMFFDAWIDKEIGTADADTAKSSFLDDSSQATLHDHVVDPPNAAEMGGAGPFRSGSTLFPRRLQWSSLPQPKFANRLHKVRRGSHLLRDANQVTHVLESVYLNFYTKKRVFHAKFEFVQNQASTGLKDLQLLLSIIQGVVRSFRTFRTKIRSICEGRNVKSDRFTGQTDPDHFMRVEVWPALVRSTSSWVSASDGLTGKLESKVCAPLEELIRGTKNRREILQRSGERWFQQIASTKAQVEEVKAKKEIADKMADQCKQDFRSQEQVLMAENGTDGLDKKYHVNKKRLRVLAQKKVAASKKAEEYRLQFAERVASLSRELTNFSESLSAILKDFRKDEKRRIHQVQKLLEESALLCIACVSELSQSVRSTLGRVVKTGLSHVKGEHQDTDVEKEKEKSEKASASSQDNTGDDFEYWVEKLRYAEGVYKSLQDFSEVRMTATEQLSMQLLKLSEDTGEGSFTSLQRALGGVREAFAETGRVIGQGASALRKNIVNPTIEIRSTLKDTYNVQKSARQGLLNKSMQATKATRRAKSHLTRESEIMEICTQEIAKALQEKRDLTEKQFEGDDHVSEAGKLDEKERRFRGALHALYSSDPLAKNNKNLERLANKAKTCADDKVEAQKQFDQALQVEEKVKAEYSEAMHRSFVAFNRLERERIRKTVNGLEDHVLAEKEMFAGITEVMEKTKGLVKLIDSESDLRLHEELDRRTEQYTKTALRVFNRHPSFHDIAASSPDGFLGSDREIDTEEELMPGLMLHQYGSSTNIDIQDSSRRKFNSTNHPSQIISEEVQLSFPRQLWFGFSTILERFKAYKLRLKSMQHYTKHLEAYLLETFKSFVKLAQKLQGHAVSPDEPNPDPMLVWLDRTRQTLLHEAEVFKEGSQACLQISTAARTLKKEIKDVIAVHFRRKQEMDKNLTESNKALEEARTDQLRKQQMKNEAETKQFEKKLLFTLRNDEEVAKRHLQEAERQLVRVRGIFDDCMSQILQRMQTNQLEHIVGCSDLLASFVKMQGNLAKGWKTSPMIRELPLRLSENAEPVFIEGDVDAVVDRAALDTLEDDFFSLKEPKGAPKEPTTRSRPVSCKEVEANLEKTRDICDLLLEVLPEKATVESNTNMKILYLLEKYPLMDVTMQSKKLKRRSLPRFSKSSTTEEASKSEEQSKNLEWLQCTYSEWITKGAAAASTQSQNRGEVSMLYNASKAVSSNWKLHCETTLQTVSSSTANMILHAKQLKALVQTKLRDIRRIRVSLKQQLQKRTVKLELAKAKKSKRVEKLLQKESAKERTNYVTRESGEARKARKVEAALRKVRSADENLEVSKLLLEESNVLIREEAAKIWRIYDKVEYQRYAILRNVLKTAIASRSSLTQQLARYAEQSAEQIESIDPHVDVQQFIKHNHKGLEKPGTVEEACRVLRMPNE